MRVFFSDQVFEMELFANNIPGDVWTDNTGKRFIYMGKSLYAIIVSEDQDEI